MVAETTQMPRLQSQYQDVVASKVRETFSLANPNQLPRISKILVNSGVGRFLENQKLKPEIRDTVIDTLTTITGQKPIMVMAKRSVANFKVREGAPSAFVVTLRRARTVSYTHLPLPTTPYV